MRQILFRGKRVDNGEWRYGIPCYEDGDTYINDEGRMYAAIKVHPETVGQYLEQNDAENNPVFDGDRVKFVVPETDKSKGTIVVDKGFIKIIFDTYPNDKVLLFDHDFERMIVTGNIHDKQTNELHKENT